MVGPTVIPNLKLANIVAYNVFTPETLSRIVQKAAKLDIFLSSRPNFGLREGWNLIQEGPECLFQEIAIVFDKPGEAIDDYETQLQLIQNLRRLGSICNCGRHLSNTGSSKS